VAIKLGTATPSNYKLGSASVSKVYLGTSQVWPVASAFTPMAVLLTSGTSYVIPPGATTMKAWAVGSGGGYDASAAGGCAYKTWSVTGGASVSYSVGGRPTGTSRLGNPSTVTYGGVTITGGAAGKNSFPADANVAGTYSGGDGGANGGRIYTGAANWSGGAVGGSASQASCGRTRATDVSGLFAAVALAGGKTTEDCAANAPAFGSGGTYDKYNLNSKGPGYGGGIGTQYQTPVGGAVVLYFT